MPDPYERHSRNAWEWGPAPARGQTRAAAADQDLAKAKRPPAKKDPKLCKARHWQGPHTPEFQMTHYSWKTVGCAWGPDWTKDQPRWSCYHNQVCSGCGKVLVTWVTAVACPDYHEITEQELAGVEARITERNRLFDARYARRPVIDGPQGYRKPKEKQ